MSTIESTTLYFTNGSSDKVYSAEIVESDEGHFVNFAYGRRGAAMQTGTKTKNPVDLDKARKIYEKLVAGKMAKGYSPGESGTPYQGTPKGDLQSGIFPQLLNAIDEVETQQLLLDNDYIAQEKKDGKRILARRDENGVVGINRKGLIVALPVPVATATAALEADCTLDGELVGDTLHVFDLLAVGGRSLIHEEYGTRMQELYELMDPRNRTQVDRQHLRAVDTAIGTRGKTDLMDRLRGSNAEGIVFKDIWAPYTPGRPNEGGPQLKYKFYKTATVVVLAHNSQRSVSMGVRDHNNTWVSCGNVTVPPNQDIPFIGALIEVRYLYAFPQGHALYQPTLLGPRLDLESEDATITQLQYKSD
jgi:bifunctional non-homologous end joining protein LigD